MGAEAGLVFFVVVVAVAFYWILLRPVMAQQRRQRSDPQNLEVGDEVLTQAGFIARVKDIRVPSEGPTEIVLELGPGLEVRAYATAIVQKLGLATGHETRDTIKASTRDSCSLSRVPVTCLGV